MKTQTQEQTFEEKWSDPSGYFHTIGGLKQTNKENGYYFFSPATMKFFKSKVHGGIRHGKYFITSEQPPYGPRQYKVREIASIKGDINNDPLGCWFNELRDASNALRNHVTQLTTNNTTAQ